MIYGLNYWVLFGLFYLLLLTWQDLTNNRLVDDRRNWFMMGVSVSLISHYTNSLLYFILLIIIIISLVWFFKRFKTIGEADINSIAWIFLGFGIMGLLYLAVFSSIFLVLSVLYGFIKNVIFKYKGFVPFYPVLLFSFSLSCLILGLV